MMEAGVTSETSVLPLHGDVPVAFPFSLLLESEVSHDLSLSGPFRAAVLKLGSLRCPWIDFRGP
jgi:hypothetical protein